MKALTDSEVTARLAHLSECIAECDRAHSPEDLEAASAKLKAYVDSLTPVQQYQLLAGPR